MDTKKLAEFLKVEAELKEIEERHRKLRLSILSDLKASKMESADTAYGTFTVARRAMWKYSKAIDKLMEKVKVAKVKEEQRGTAKKEETEYLRFTPQIKE